MRADQLLVAQGLAPTRSAAQRLIARGAVRWLGPKGWAVPAKAGEDLPTDCAIEVTDDAELRWVSRGGLKLAGALERCGVAVAGRHALDIGQSTGGFTDVLLSRGAAKVYAVDVGTNQLAWKLRNDPRVVVHEQTNARNLTSEIIPEPVDIIVCDASFISLAKVLDRALDFAREGGRLVALVKPQFEAERGEIGKGGVVRDPAVRERVCAAAADWVRSRGWSVYGMVESPITGPEGNVEYLLAARLSAPRRAA